MTKVDEEEAEEPSLDMMDMGRPTRGRGEEAEIAKESERQERGAMMVEEEGEEERTRDSLSSACGSSALQSSSAAFSSSLPWNPGSPPQKSALPPPSLPLSTAAAAVLAEAENRNENDEVLANSCSAQIAVARRRHQGGADGREESPRPHPSPATRDGTDDEDANKDDTDNTTCCWTKTGGDTQGGGRALLSRDEDAFSPWIEASSSSSSSDTRVDTRSSSPVLSGNAPHVLKKSGAPSPRINDDDDDDDDDSHSHGRGCRDTSPFAILTTSSSQNHHFLHTPPPPLPLLSSSSNHPASDDLSPRVFLSSSSPLKGSGNSLPSARSSRKTSRESAGDSPSSVEDLGTSQYIVRPSETSDASGLSSSMPQSSAHSKSGRPSTPGATSMSALLTLPVSPSALFPDEVSMSVPSDASSSSSSTSTTEVTTGGSTGKGGEGEALPAYTLIPSPGKLSASSSSGLLREEETEAASSMPTDLKESYKGEKNGRHTARASNGSHTSSPVDAAACAAKSPAGPSAAGGGGAEVAASPDQEGRFANKKSSPPSHSGAPGDSGRGEFSVDLDLDKVDGVTDQDADSSKRKKGRREALAAQPLASAFSPPRLRGGKAGEGEGEEEEEEEEVLGGATDLAPQANQTKDLNGVSPGGGGDREGREGDSFEKLGSSGGGGQKDKDGGSSLSPPGSQQSVHGSCETPPVDTSTESVRSRGSTGVCRTSQTLTAGGGGDVSSALPPPSLSREDDEDMKKRYSSITSSSATSLDRARRRLELVNDAEAQKMLSTLMHPDDQEGRRFLQQVREENSVRPGGQPGSREGEEAADYEGNQGGELGQQHQQHQRYLDRPYGGAGDAQHHPAHSRRVSSSSGGGLSLGGWSWRGGGKGPVQQQGGGGSALDGSHQLANSSTGQQQNSGGGGTASRLFRAFNFGIPGFRGTSSVTTGSHVLASSSSSPRTEGGKSESIDQMSTTDGAGGGGGGWIGAEGLNGSGLSSTTAALGGGGSYRI